MPAEEKPLQKRESKTTNIISRTKAKPNPSPKPDVLHKPGAQRSLGIAVKTSEKDPPSSVLLDNMVKVSPPRLTSATTTIGASWESLPPVLQTLGSVQFVQKLAFRCNFKSRCAREVADS